MGVIVAGVLGDGAPPASGTVGGLAANGGEVTLSTADKSRAELLPGDSMTAGGRLTIGGMALEVTASGDLLIWEPSSGRQLWRLYTKAGAGATLHNDPSGVLEMLAASGSRTWSTRASSANATLRLESSAYRLGPNGAVHFVYRLSYVPTSEAKPQVTIFGTEIRPEPLFQGPPCPGAIPAGVTPGPVPKFWCTQFPSDLPAPPVAGQAAPEAPGASATFSHAWSYPSGLVLRSIRVTDGRRDGACASLLLRPIYDGRRSPAARQVRVCDGQGSRTVAEMDLSAPSGVRIRRLDVVLRSVRAGVETGIRRWSVNAPY